MKFGGTSVGSANALVKATQIVKDARAEYPRVVVITSAMAGVTDLLLDCAKQATQGQSGFTSAFGSHSERYSFFSGR